MINVDIEEEYGTRIIYGANQPEYKPLITNVDYEGGTFSVWELTQEERLAILHGAKIGLRMLTGGQPLQPIALGVEGTDSWPYKKVGE